MTTADVLITIRDLRFAYGLHLPEVLRGITFEIRDGTVTALLGPNGSGKTTLLNLILGWLKPTDGALELAGRPLTDYSRRERSRAIGLVPQEEPITFELDVLDYVLMGRAPFLDLLETPGIEDRRAAMAVIDRLGLMGVVGRRVMELSGGEKQLAVMARSLVQDPRVLLLDEPLSHLDLSNTRRILDVMEQLRRQGKTVLFTTHDPNAAAAVADAVVLMRRGRLVAGGPSEAILTPERLSATYDVPIEVIHAGGRILIPLPAPKP